MVQVHKHTILTFTDGVLLSLWYNGSTRGLGVRDLGSIPGNDHARVAKWSNAIGLGPIIASSNLAMCTLDL